MKNFIQENSSSKRIEWIDFAKGILILFVIVGHSTGIAIIRGTIYSFHMPAFFVLSGMTMKLYSDWADISKQIRRLFKSLVLPAILLLVTSFGENLLGSIHKQSFSIHSFLLMMLEETLWTGGTRFKLQNYLIIAKGGMYWFLIVLFGDKVILYLMYFWFNHVIGSKISEGSKKIVNIIIMAITVCFGVWLGAHNYWLPFSVDLMLSTVCFLSIGYRARDRVKKRNKRVGFLSNLFLWAFFFFLIGICCDAYIDIKIRRYPLFPLCYICAICGTLALCYFSQLLKPSLFYFRVLQYIGRHSLVLFCIHMWDHWYCDWFADICSNGFFQTAFRILADVAVMFAFLSVKNAIYKRDLK